MKFDWSSYLELAETLYDEASKPSRQANNSSINEAKIRSCISRAYYSAFCLARNYLRDIEGDSDLKTAKVSVHDYVIKEFKNSRDKHKRHLGQCLFNLRVLRNEVDYEDYIPFNHLFNKAQIAFKEAKKVMELLNKLTSSQNP